MKLVLHANLIVIDPSSSLLARASKDLTIKNPRYYMQLNMGHQNIQEPETFQMFSYDGKVLELPRGYDISSFLSEFSDIEDKMVDTGPLLQFAKKPSPYPYQQKAADLFVKAQQGGVIAGCGSGKTEVAITAMFMLRRSTLVLVHREDLLRQWRDRIVSRFGYEPGLIYAAKKQVKDITVATVQSLYSSGGLAKFNEENFYQRFSMVVLDEAHHAPAQSWLTILSKCPARYRLWLTATDKRKDGLGHTIPLSCGSIVYKLLRKEQLDCGMLVVPRYVQHRIPFVKGPFKRNVFVRGVRKEITDIRRLDNLLIHCRERNEYIIRQAAASFNEGRHVLVLSPRFSSHCENLYGIAIKQGLPARLLVASGKYKIHGASREALLEGMRQGSERFVIATNIAEEGLDVPILDTLHLAYPMSNCEQAAGRIMRTNVEGKLAPEVHDYVDCLQGYLNDKVDSRERFFRGLGSKFEVRDLLAGEHLMIERGVGL